MKEKELNMEIIEIQDQELEIIFQPTDILTDNMDLIVGGAGQPGIPGEPGKPGTPGDCTVKFDCICKGLCIFDIF